MWVTGLGLILLVLLLAGLVALTLWLLNEVLHFRRRRPRNGRQGSTGATGPNSIVTGPTGDTGCTGADRNLSVSSARLAPVYR